MSHYPTPIGSYANGPVVTIDPSTPVAKVHALLEGHGISAVPVMKDDVAIGVVSRTDLLKRGSVRPRDGARRRLVIDFPDLTAADVMNEGIVTASAVTPVRDAAQLMLSQRIHRVFVTTEERIEGVFGTREVMLAIKDSRDARPIGEIMSHKPFTIPAEASVHLATDRLANAHTQGLVVIDPEGWPAGLYTQRDALLARDLGPESPVEAAMSYGMLCLHTSTPLFRAAAQAEGTRARRVLVIEDKHVVGVVTGLDFARVAAHA